MSSLIGLIVIVLLVGLVYTWYRCHRQLRAKGYGHALIATTFLGLLIVCFGIGGSMRTDTQQALVPEPLWILVVLGLTWTLPTRSGAIRDGRVVHVGPRRAGKRRALTAIVWAWVAAIGGGVMTLFFTWQLITPTVVPRDEGVPAWIASLFIAIGLTMHMRRVARRSRSAPEILEPSTTTVLYLRAFDEEQRPFAIGPRSVLRTYTSQYVAHTPFSRGDPTIKLTLEDYLDEAITTQIGPFVGLGNPYDRLAPDGAVREYAPDDQWQTRFLALARSARCIVVSIGGSANLEWELTQIKEQGLGEKLCLFTVPVVPGHDRRVRNMLLRSASKRRRLAEEDWARASTILQRAGFTCGANPGPGAAVTFDADGNRMVITADAESPDDFIRPVADWFNHGQKTGRCVAVRCDRCGASTHVALDAPTAGARCFTCRQQEELAGKPFFVRHPVISVAWATTTFVIAVVITETMNWRSFSLVLVFWFLLWIPPVAVSWIRRPRANINAS